MAKAGSTSKSPVVEIAKRHEQVDFSKPVRLNSGFWAYIRPVTASLIDEAQSMLPYPDVPMWYNADKERDEPNPNDPGYIAAIADVDRRRQLAAIDAIVMFGVDLCNKDGEIVEVSDLVEDDRWLRKLKVMSKRGLVDLESYDLEDEIEKEFVLKRYIAVTTGDYDLIMKAAGVVAQEEANALNMFQGDEE